MIVVSPMILDSSGNVLRRIDPVNVSLDLQLEPLSSAEIELKPGDTIPERSWVSVYTEHGLAGIFRSRPQRDRYGERSSRVSLVHGACELNDYLTTKGGDQEQDPANTAIAYIMQFYLGTHWRLGTVSATSSVVYQLNGSGVLDAIAEIMDQLPGYMLVFDQSVTPWTVNVLPRPETVSAEGRLSRNISSVEISRDDTSICTRVYYGENDLFVEDAAAIQKYGVIEYRITESGLETSQLAAIAQAYLDSHKEPKLSVSISAIDFYNATGEPLDRITLGSKYRLAIPDAETEENRVIEAIICSIHYDSVFSNNPQITLASDPDTIITFLKKQRRSGGSARQIAKEEADKQYQHWVTENDVYKRSVYKIMGVMYDENGNVIYQTDPVTGEVIVDDAGNPVPVYNTESDGSIAGQVTESATSLETLYTKTGVRTLPSGETSIVSYTSKVKQTADSIKSEVEAARDGKTSLKSRIDQEADKIGLFVELKNGQYVIKRAGIIAAINEDGTSTTTISADKIDLHGYVKAEDLEAVDAKIENITSNTITANTIVSAATGRFSQLWVEGSVGGQSVSALVDNAINSITLSGPVNDVYTLTATRLDGSTVTIGNFNRAASSGTTLTGEWSGRYYTVTASPQGVTKTGIVYDGLVPTGSITKNGKNVSRNFIVYSDDGEGDADTIIMQKSVTINADSVYTDGQDSVVSTFDTPSFVPSSVSPTDLLKGTVRRYHVTKDGTDVVDSYFRVPNYSATLTPASTSGTKTTLSDGVYGLYVTKDGAAEQIPIAYYEVSGGTVASGEITDILTRDGKVTYNSTSEMISVLLRATGTGITNAPYDDSVNLSVSASGVTLTKGNLTNTSTDTHNHIYAGRYTVKGSGGGLFKVENIDTISASVSPLPINLQLTQPYSTPFTWNPTTHKYTYTVKSGLQVDGSNVLSYETDDAVFDPSNAIQHGFDVCHDSISLSAVTQTLAAGDSITIYPKAKSDVSAANASNIVSAGITITAASGGSGGTRTARQLLTPGGADTITLAATDTETSSHNLVAYYTSGTDTTTLPIKIDAKEVYDAGVTAGLGGIVNVVKQPWVSNTCEFRPSAGTGSSASVTITAEATKVAPASATETGEIVLKDGDNPITTKNLYLRPRTLDGQSYVVLTDSSSIVSMGNILAKYSASGGGSESSVYSIVQNGTITYSSDYQTAFVPVAAKDENGTTLLSSSIAADISDAWQNGYTEGLAAGSGMEVQDTKDIRSNPITSNNSDIRIDPDGSALAMGHVRLAVNVPQEITDAALYRSNDSVSTYNTWSGYTIDQLTTKYAQLRIAQANGTNAYVKIDASEVYERGVAAGADTAGYRLTPVELAGTPNYFRSINVPTGTTTVNVVTGSGALYQVNSNGSLYLCSVEVSRTVQGYLYQNNGSGFERVPGTGNGSWFYVDGNVTRLMRASNLKVSAASTTQYTVATGSRQAYVTDSSGSIVFYTQGRTVTDTYYIKTS